MPTLRLALALLAPLLVLPAAAEARTPPRLADPAVLAALEAEDRAQAPMVLPKHAAPWEDESMWTLPPERGAAPTGKVRTFAEYEPNEGIFIRWGSFSALHAEMVVPLTTADPPSKVWIAVTGSSQQNTARNALQAAGADLDLVNFIVQPCTNNGNCSVWMRDYGPRFIENDGRRAIVDHLYNRPSRTADNAFPGLVAAAWQEPLFDIGLEHGGGNYHSFSPGDALMTELIVNENPGLTPQQVRDRYAAYQGVDLSITDPFPTFVDSTQHIDMWMLPVADDTVIIGDYPASTNGSAIPKQVTDATAADLAGRGYTVLRTPGWSAGAHYTYTNSVIVNQVALICRFGGSYTSQDAAALAVFEQALPDHDVIQVNCAGIIGSAGAIHCIVMHVPDLLFRDDNDPDL
jgi:agmatine deiminase